MADNQPPLPLGIEAFNDQNTRAKSVVNPVFLLAMATYPLTIGFSTAVRTGLMSVVSGRAPFLAGSPPPPGAPPSPPPPPPSPDLWVNIDGHSLSMTILSFAAVLGTHLILLAHILMKRPAGAPEMKKSYSFVAPFVMLVITTTYYINYLGLARYGAKMVEWLIFTGFSAVLIMMTVVMCVCPVRQSNLVQVAEAEAA